MTFRSRTTGEIGSSTRIARTVTFAGTVVDTSGTNEYLRTGESKTTRDVVTPGFFRKIKSGEIINNPFFSIEERYQHSWTDSHARRNTGSGTTIRDHINMPGYTFPLIVPPDPTTESIDRESLVAVASTAALSRVLQPELQGLVEVAEFHKTMELFRVRTGFLNRHLASILRFAQKKGKLRKGVNFFAENWLRYRYGIMPLVYSVETALLELGKVRSRRLKATAKEEMEASGTTYSDNTTGAFWNLSFTHHHSRKFSVHAGVLYEFTGSYNELGFKITDIPPAAWELLTLSFVADWAGNIGDYISAVTPKVGGRILASWATTRDQYARQTSSTATWKNVSGFSVVASPGGGCEYSSLTKTRRPGLKPKLAFRTNALQKVSAPKRALDAIALTVVLLKGRLPSGGRI